MTETPSWWSDPWELSADLAKIAKQWAATRSILEDDQLFELSDPEVSGWSCGQHAGHCVLVARSIADRIEGHLADPGREADRQTSELATRVLAAGHFARGVAKAPHDLDPSGWGREAFLSLLPEAIASWERISARAAELPDLRARSRHFSLGYLTSTEWVRMCAVHTAHHLKVIRDIAGEGVFEPSAPTTPATTRRKGT